jgi:CubicO group peptidase (beta-lactamase class C family)
MLSLPRLPLLCLALACQIFTPPAHADRVDDLVQREMTRQHIPGLALAVVQHGKVIKQKGYGWANLEHQVPVTPDTVFQSGSLGKQFAAALVQLLVADGKLKLDDFISQHLPDAPKAWEKITVRHLLTHTSGMGEPFEKLDLRKDYSDAELIKLESEFALLSQPGEKWSYSNMGYQVLGILCNRVGGKFYGDQLALRVFAPLGMQAAIISERNLVPHRAAGYDWDKGWKNQQWVSPSNNTTADGSLYLTLRDWVRWDAALYRDKPLSAAQKQQAWTPVTLNDGSSAPYGFGWELSPQNGHRRVGHSGAWQGFTTYIARFPDDQLSVIVLTNAANARPGKIGDAVIGLYLPALAQPPAKPITDSEPDVTKQVRTLLLQLADGSIKPAPFSERLAAELFPALAQQFGTELRELGRLADLALLSRKVDGEHRLYRYRASFPKGNELLDLTFDKAGRIDKIDLIAE